MERSSRRRGAGRGAWLLLVVGVVAVSGALAVSILADQARRRAAYDQYASAIEPACDAIAAYEMSLDTGSPDSSDVVLAAWARVDGTPLPSPLEPSVAAARTRLGDLVGGRDLTTSAGVDDVAAACVALVGAARTVTGPPPPTGPAAPS
jgi:hypothetical protein